MSFKTLPPEAQLYFIQTRLTETMDTAAASMAIGQTIEGMINARAEAGTEQIEILNNDGLVAGLATAVRLLNQSQLESIGVINEMVEEYKV
jgi:CBS-domain-containing membrane protein